MEKIKLIYPNYITWYVSLANTETPFDVFGASHRKKIRKTLREFDTQDEYQFITEEVTPEYLKQFLPLYTALIESKENGGVYDVEGHILQMINEGHTYKTISLYRNTVLVGGFIYAVYDDYISTAYKVFPRSFEGSFRSSPTMMAEYFLYERAIAQKKAYIKHGRDKNQFGKNYAIGLAIFKLQLGCIPQPSAHAETVWHHSLEYTPDQDQLVFVGDEKKKTLDAMMLLTAQSLEQAQETYQELFVQQTIPIKYRHVS